MLRPNIVVFSSFLVLLAQAQLNTSFLSDPLNDILDVLGINASTIQLETQRCSEGNNSALLYGNGTIGQDFHFRGVALGGLFELEPWMTPSLFYQFLGATSKFGSNARNKIGVDSTTFCLALGKEEANRQLRAHWDSWVTEEIIKTLKSQGVDHIRLPVGDYMYIAYEPFNGCWDGSLEVLERVLGWCGKYNIGVILDVHCMRSSQNGYDNSGKASNWEWTSDLDANVTTWTHWPIQAGNWPGIYDLKEGSYPSINYTNIDFSIRVIDTIIDMYKGNIPTQKQNSNRNNSS